MATTFTREKRPEEEITAQVDFSSQVLSGEKLIEDNLAVTVKNLMTDVSTPSFLSGDATLDGTSLVVSQNVSGGVDGQAFSLLFQTGATDYGSAGYAAEINVLVTTRPASALMFTSRDGLKRSLGVASTDTSDDLLLDEYIIFASAYFRNRIKRDIYFDSYVENVYLREAIESNTQVKLYNYPVQSIQQIVSYSADGVIQETITDPTTWGYDSEGRFWLHDGHTFNNFPDYNQITYKAGYIKIPEDIEEKTRGLAAIAYRTKGREGIMAEKIGQYSYTIRSIDDFPKSMRVEVADLGIEGVINRYMRRDGVYV